MGSQGMNVVREHFMAKVGGRGRAAKGGGGGMKPGARGRHLDQCYSQAG